MVFQRRRAVFAFPFQTSHTITEALWRNSNVLVDDCDETQHLQMIRSSQSENTTGREDRTLAEDSQCLKKLLKLK